MTYKDDAHRARLNTSVREGPGADPLPVGEPGKTEAQCIAHLALAGGHVVHPLRDGGYVVAWRGLFRECKDLSELIAHVRRVCGRAVQL